MGSEPKGGLPDLDKELTCSICTDILYQPLTLLNCLHTFCGSCLKEWFSWQANHPERTHPYTCPACRATVRETKPNATVTSLLDMYLQANPGRGKTDEDKRDVARKYKPGDTVLPPLPTRRARAEDDEDRRLVDQIRQLSLWSPRGTRSDDSGQPRDRRPGHRRRQSGNDRASGENRERRTQDGRLRQRDGSRLPATDPTGRSSDAQLQEEPTRQIEHQSSLRSMLSAPDIDWAAIEQEIARQIIEDGLLDDLDLSNIDISEEDEISERIAEAYRRRQGVRPRIERILRREPDSERSTAREGGGERRQRPHSRSQSASTQTRDARRARSGIQSNASSAQDEQGARPGGHTRRSTSSIPSPQHGRRASDLSHVAMRSSIDVSSRSQAFQTPRFRRSASSEYTGNGESAEPRVGRDARQVNGQESTVMASHADMPSTPQRRPQRRIDVVNDSPRSAANASPSTSRRHSAESTVIHDRLQSETSHDLNIHHPRRSPQTAPNAAGTSRARPMLYPEPSISCSKCQKPHIEYELHYNCPQCENGDFNLCLSCYRQGSGCHHWYGFGYAAWSRYERMAPPGGYPPNHPLPHTLTGHRYVRPTQSLLQPASGSSSRRLMTTEDPARRLQEGVFCSMCAAFANGCFWKCDVCNEGEWGFCNHCVNTGQCCTHFLLPLILLAPSIAVAKDGGGPSHHNHNHHRHHHSSTPGGPDSSSISQPPASATILRDPWVIEHGPLKPLSMSTACNICRLPIQPSSARYHCFQCNDGDYDICSPCYLKLCGNGKISPENGFKGWRRCLRGHRMIVLGFEDRDGGRRRVVVRDLVGGFALKEDEEEKEESHDVGYEGSVARDPAGGEAGRRGHYSFNWHEGPDGRRQSKVISKNVAAATTNSSNSNSRTKPPTSSSNSNNNNTATTSTSNPNPHSTSTDNQDHRFPPDGGVGMRVHALWSYFPAETVSDELMFPRGAEIREVENINGDWYWGCYAGRKGLFPGPYVAVVDIVGMGS